MINSFGENSLSVEEPNKFVSQVSANNSNLNKPSLVYSGSNLSNDNLNKVQNSNQFNNSNLNSYSNNNINNNIQKVNSNNFSNNFLNNNKISDFNQNKMEVEDLCVCQVCGDPNITYLECLDVICLNCLESMIQKNLYNVNCVKCKSAIQPEYIKNIIGIDRYHDYENKIIQAQLGGEKIINCTKCNEKIIFEKGNVNYNEKDGQGNKMSASLCEEYANQRCRCPKCKTEFCVNCQASPYHLAKTCNDHRHYQEAKKCRFCEEAIGKNNKGPAETCCKNSECIERYNKSCKKKLACGHDCFGHSKEKGCLSCLNSECKGYNDKYNQNSSEYCVICYTEALGSAPVVKADCGHYYHHHCIEKKLKEKWVGPKITFNYAECPQCKGWLNFPNNSDLQNVVKESTDLYEDIKKKIFERMKFEGLDKDKRLSDANDPFFNKPLEFGLKSIAYYMCHICKKPYFAGMRNCLQDDSSNNRQHDPKELICGGCGALDGVAGISDCKKHGKEFIEYKCKFCCGVSSWFCWGTTHFCESCHSRQCKGDYVTKIPKNKLPVCEGKNKCGLKIDHPANGEEFALGCSLCKNEAANMKSY